MRNPLISFVALLFFGLIFGSIQAQPGSEMYFRNISSELHLPSQECYNLLQDRKGYIWICTENGLLKCSKGQQKIFNKQNGLPENAVYYLEELQDGRLMMLTSRNRVLYLKNDTLREDRLCGLIQKHIRTHSRFGSFDIGYVLHRKDNGDLVITTQQHSYYVRHQKAQIFDLLLGQKVPDEPYLVVDLDAQPALYYKRNIVGHYELNNTKENLCIELIKNGVSKRVTIPLPCRYLVDWRTRMVHANGYTFLTIDNHLIQIDPQGRVKTIPFNGVITAIYLHKQHGLWVGVTSGGVCHYPDYRTLDSSRQGLSGRTVSSILVDREGGAWCTTTDKGVYYSAQYQVTYFPENKALNRKTTFFKTMGSQLFLSTQVDQLLTIDKQAVRSYKLLSTGNSEITDVTEFEGKRYVGSKGYLAELSQQNQVRKIIINPKIIKGRITTYQLDATRRYLYVLGVGLLFRIHQGGVETVGPNLKSKARCFKVVSDSLVYVGCNDGLYKINLQDNSQEKIKTINSAVSKIIRSGDGALYCTTKEQGLFRLWQDQPQKIRLPGDPLILNDLVADKNGMLWISSNEGLITCSKSAKGFSAHRYNTANGLISNSIDKLCMVDRYLYYSTPDGISTLPIAATLINRVPPKLYVHQIRCGDSLLNPAQRTFDLNYRQNSLEITFDPLYFRQGNREGLLYQLSGWQSDYKKTNQNTLIFEQLPAATYTLSVYGVNNDGLRSTVPLVLQFTIHPPFWKSTWFIIAATLIIALLLLLSILRVIRNIQRREEEKTRINQLISESQLSALQAQMNPHFIFNALNSIQNYILHNKQEDAYNYLTKFSKLVRLVLNHSRAKQVTLQSELDLLQLYVAFEQLRFDHSFAFVLTVSEDLQPQEIEIPTMLLQPYVENAIWHGLMNLNKQRKAVLKVAVSSEKGLLKVVIEDNGIGRARAREFRANALHHSVAMQLTDERLKIINSTLQNAQVRVVVHDLYDQHQQAIGTKVVLYLPIG